MGVSLEVDFDVIILETEHCSGHLVSTGGVIWLNAMMGFLLEVPGISATGWTRWGSIWAFHSLPFPFLPPSLSCRWEVEWCTRCCTTQHRTVQVAQNFSLRVSVRNGVPKKRVPTRNPMLCRAEFVCAHCTHYVQYRRVQPVLRTLLRIG